MMRDEELARSAEAILLWHVCASCQFRFPVVTTVGSAERRELRCSLGGMPEVNPQDSCDRWQGWKPPAPDNCKVGAAPKGGP